MPHPDVEHMLALVKEKTGYAVSVTVDAELTTHSAMVSASNTLPGHVVRVNPKYDRYGNYLVAMQCAMLLAQWADPKRVAVFITYPEKLAFQKKKLLPKVVQKGLNEPMASAYLDQIVKGLLQQLNSIPLQIRAMEICYELCPGLREEQLAMVAADLREMTAVLMPDVRKYAPEEIYDRSVAMNAAFVRNWANISGDTIALLPFTSLGFTKKGDELLASITGLVKDDPAWCIKAVNAWGEILRMKGWYEFTYWEQ